MSANTIIATASATTKSQNQDSISEFEAENIKAIVVADGLGSFKYPKLASQRVVEFFRNEVEAISARNEILTMQAVVEMFRKSKLDLIDFGNENLKEHEKSENNLFGTTVIALFEFDTKFLMAYVGNGAIWHIRGNFNEFPDSYHFPWNAMNYLNPHTIPERGKEALYRLISNNRSDFECRPTVIEIQKDTEYGDMFMICTDGIYSADQLKAGKNDKGLWVRYEESMLKYFQFLKTTLMNGKVNNKKDIERMLCDYLEELKPLLDDDASVGILLSQEALSYQLRCVD